MANAAKAGCRKLEKIFGFEVNRRSACFFICFGKTKVLPNTIQLRTAFRAVNGSVQISFIYAEPAAYLTVGLVYTVACDTGGPFSRRQMTHFDIREQGLFKCHARR